MVSWPKIQNMWNEFMLLLLYCRYLDYIQLMAYDLNGAWANYTGINAPLYPRHDEEGDQRYLNVVSNLIFNQECIPVGCVPPAAVAVPGGLHQAPPRAGTPWSRPPWSRHPREQTPPGQAPPLVNRILDTRLWKYYLAPNFVCGR